MKRLFCKLKNNYISCFACFFFLSVAIYLLMGIFTGGKSLLRVFFLNTDDLFMDFFNSIRDASQGIGAYTERNVIYPPMANLIFLILSRITPDAYNNTSFDDRYLWKEYPVNSILIWTFVLVTAVLVFLVVFRSIQTAQTEKKQKWLFLLLAMFGIPFLNLLERGNIMSLAFLGLLIFAATYRSERALFRELGLIALAFSFSIKLYPIIFAWILLTDKRYKEFFRCALYSLILLIVPTFFFGGPICLWWILQNILRFSSVGSSSVMAAISRFTHLPEALLTVLTYVPFLLGAFSFLVAPFVHRERWKIWASGCIAFVSYPALASIYAWALFIIPILFLFRDGHEKNWIVESRRSWYLIPMSIPFLYFPFSLRSIPFLKRFLAQFATVPTVNAMLVYVCMTVLAFWAAADTLLELRARIREKKQSVQA